LARVFPAIEYERHSNVGDSKEAEMVLRRIGALSAAKLSGVIYVIFGFIAGLSFSIVLLFTPTSSDAGSGFDMIHVIANVTILPVMWGVMGFVFGLIGAAIYNVVAGRIGGLELELEATDA